jgi:hypothetical protein
VPMVCKHVHDTEAIAYCHTLGLNVLTVPRLASHSSS